MTPNELRIALRTLVEQAISDAYFAGLQEGGIAPEEFTEEDAQEADNLIAEQFDFVSGFANAIAEGCDDKQALYARADLWVHSIASAGQRGLASAKENEMVTWRLGAAEDHCTTCTTLNGQKHRRKWFAERNYFPQTPGSALECGGFECQCTLSP